MCVVNARKTLADFQNYLKEVKYATWNKRPGIQDSIKIPTHNHFYQVPSNFKSKMCKPVANIKSNKKPIPLMNIAVKPPTTLLKSNMEQVKTQIKSNIDHVNTFLTTADRRNTRVSKKDFKTGVCCAMARFFAYYADDLSSRQRMAVCFIEYII